MNYDFAITGIGLCVGGMTDHEDLIETIITQKKPVGNKAKPDAAHAIRAALKYRDEKPVMLISHAEISRETCDAFSFAEHRTVHGFGGMLEAAANLFAEKRYENILLLGQREEGYAAVLLSARPERCFAEAEITVKEPSLASTSPMDAMMQLITAVTEIRFAFRLDGAPQESGTHIWHWMEKRTRSLVIDGVEIALKEAARVNRAFFASKRYLIPVTFQTTAEAKEKLLRLQRDAVTLGLYQTMQTYVNEWKNGGRGAHIIVLLAESMESLRAQTDELLTKCDDLLSDGFVWQSRTGSLYIRRSTDAPKIVFMNPPGGMFYSKPFHRYVSKLYDFVDEPFIPERNVFTNLSRNEMLHRYLNEVNITYVVMYLLKTIGITPDYLSGASMGEVVFDLSNSVTKGKAGMENDLDRAMASLETTIRSALEGKKDHELSYFGREIQLAKYYLKCDAERAKKATLGYEDVFVIIEGSPKDILICGEKSSCENLIRELGCIAMEMDDPMYIHTPVLEKEFETIRAELTEAGVCLDTKHLPYQLFSTYMKKEMDDSTETFAENFAAIVTRSVNYTDAIRALYDRGARVFIDLSTTQLCGNWAKETLSVHADVKVLSIYENKDTADYLLELCTAMLAGNVTFDFEKMYSKLTFVCDKPTETPTEKPAVSAVKIQTPPIKVQQKEEVKTMEKEKIPQTPVTADAYIDTEPQLQQYIANQMALNQKAYELYLDAENKLFAQLMDAYAGKKQAPAPVKKNYLWGREEVIEMTDRSMAAVLGDQYKEVDQYPIRARMPLPPFLFVSRIVSIDAEFGKLRPSSIVAEYDLDETCVFRTGDKQISPLIGSEASHIAIFLIAYMGLDAMSKGTLSYRAIDSSQVSYSERPFRVGDTMRTVLKINRFVQNGSTILLFFTFETYNGDELIAITEATGGFFTKAELSSNKGIIAPKKLLKKAEPKEFLHFSDSPVTSYNENEVSSFYNGRYAECFGPYKEPSLKETYYVHDMKMIDRVTKIDYNGGMYGRGIICGEKQITPDMWPFKAHFKNDPVFPAIIMTDGVTQLGVFLFAHAGLLSKFESTNVTMINGNCVKSKFRGQARHGYSTLRYEVHVKDVVETDDCISVYFDAGIFNDGLQIIQVESYALKIFNDPN